MEQHGCNHSLAFGILLSLRRPVNTVRWLYRILVKCYTLRSADHAELCRDDSSTISFVNWG